MSYFGKKIKVWECSQYSPAMHSDKDVQVLFFVNKSPNPDPEYKCAGDSGFDLRAWITDADEGSKVGNDGAYITLKSLERRLIHTGLYFQLPEHTEIQVRPRSGLAIKQGISVVNTPGTVDENFRGEVCIIAINLSKSPVKITNGDRIAQAVLMPVYNKELVELCKQEEISKNTERSDGGFGHTGVN